MPRVRRQLDRRAHLIADQMDGVEELREADEVAVIAQVSRPAAALAVMHVGRACDQAEVHVIAAENDAPAPRFAA